MTLLDRIAQILSGQAIPHALIGAAALAARGVARSTFDIDLLTTDARVLAPGVWQPLRDEGAAVEIRRGDADDPLGGVVRLERAGDRPVDIVLGRQRWLTRALERAEHPGSGPPVVLARDLVLLKLYAGGTQDLWDVRELLQVSAGDCLLAEVDADLGDMPRAMRESWEHLQRGLA